MKCTIDNSEAFFFFKDINMSTLLLKFLCLSDPSVFGKLLITVRPPDRNERQKYL